MCQGVVDSAVRAVLVVVVAAVLLAPSASGFSKLEREHGRVSSALVGAGGLPDEWRTRLLPIASVLDEAGTAAASGKLNDLLGARADLDRLVPPFLAWASTQNAVVPRIEVPGIVIIDLSHSDDTYHNDTILILDVGGNDTYLNNAGGSNLASGLCDPLRARGAALLIDLGGNDTYGNATRSIDARRTCGTNGGGYYGLGALFDYAGDDKYAAGHGPANGGGWAGVGLLRDYAGDDEYVGGDGGVNGGGAAFGSGSLMDYAGDDRYASRIPEGPGPIWVNGGTNGGANLGRGCLVDFAGNDSYSAVVGGVNGGVQDAGFGLLMDFSGSDVYEEEGLGIRRDETIAPKGALGAQVDFVGFTAFPSQAGALCN